MLRRHSLLFRTALAATVLAGAAVLAHAGSYEDFFVAVKNDNAGDLVSLIKRGFDPNTLSPQGQTGLTLAVREQSLKVVRALLEQPATSIDALNQSGESALMLAALKGDLPTARLLLERGAKVNQPGWSALHYAASGPEPKLVQLLLDRGAEIDAASPNLTTPLMMAAQYGSEDNVKLLLQRGADPKRRNQRELGAADFARRAERAGLVKLLEPLQQR